MRREGWKPYVKLLADTVRSSSGGKLSLSAKKPEQLDDGSLLVTLNIDGAGISEEILRKSVVWGIPSDPEVSDEDGEPWYFPTRAWKTGENRKLYNYKKNDAPDLTETRLVPVWLESAISAARQLGSSISGKGGLSINKVLSFEGSLNKVWGGKRALRRINAVPITRGNSLLKLETSRQVTFSIEKRDKQDKGRFRLPHISHKGKICPFQTPETKNIGLQLFLAAGATLDPVPGKINTPKDSTIFSTAVGLVPYPGHTDGPRLMMGGKNLKQAVPVVGAEPALVPGYLEGKAGADLPGLQRHLKEGRFYPYLGVNALVAIMPWGGLTYEDGLVVSRSLAEKLKVSGDIIEKRFTFDLERESLLSELPGEKESVRKKYSALETRSRKIQRWFDDWVAGEKVFRFGEKLPAPSELIKLVTDFNKNHPRFESHTPASIESVRVRWVTDHLRHGDSFPRIQIVYQFRAERPLVIGDKLTGRSGNKGVVTGILDEPPRVMIGGKEFPVDLMISPCSIIGRKNPGQIIEMAHGLCLRAVEEGILADDFPRDRGLKPEEQRSRLFPALRKQGMDERGFSCTFRDPLTGEEKKTRIYAGYQYIPRLHHHAADKLQSRGASGPENLAFGQPRRGGSRSGQRLGEMENWTILSRGPDLNPGREKGLGSLDLLLSLRSDKGKTWDAAEKLLRLAGVNVRDNDSSSGFTTGPLRGIPISARLAGEIIKYRRDEGHFNKKIKDKKLSAEELCTAREDFCVVGFTDNEKNREDRWDLLPALEEWLPALADERGIKVGFDTSFKFKTEDPALDRLGKIIQGYTAQDKGVDISALTCLFTGDTNRGGGIPFYWPALRINPGLAVTLQTALGRMQSFLRKPGVKKLDQFLFKLRKYRDDLLKCLGGKRGIFVGHLLGHRVPHSGRAVIVPGPDLKLDQARIPVWMLLDLLEGHEAWSGMGLDRQELKKLVRLARGNPEAVNLVSDSLNQAIRRMDRGLWCLLLRPPALHRHSIQAFRVEAWGEKAIAIPPMITPGFNADFDGDTMAVFLPPPPWCFDLASCSIAASPGRVGDGEPQIEAGLDLALGWEALPAERREEWLVRAGFKRKSNSSLADVRDALITRGAKDSTWIDTLSGLQAEVCAASTGSATISPLELEELYGYLSDWRARAAEAGPDWSEDDFTNHQEKTEGAVEEWIRDNPGSHLSRIIKAKGSYSDLRQITGFIGLQKRFSDVEGRPLSESWIKGSFWGGLSEEELFRYSYDAREVMAMKKLATAAAGWLSWNLAEGLYDTLVVEDDCGSSDGLAFFLTDTGDIALNVIVGEKLWWKNSEPFPGDKQEAIFRIARGRSPAGGSAPLGEAELGKILETATPGSKTPFLILRSPLTCRTEGRGLCSRCAGSDPGRRLLGHQRFYTPGTPVGLIAAQAIGERGTQLAMQRFHQVGRATGKNRVHSLKGCLVRKHNADDLRERLRQLIALLRDDKDPGKTFKELPQDLIHFEIALRAPEGLKAWGEDISGRWLAAAAHRSLRKRRGLIECLHSRRSESGESLKTQVMLDIPRQGGKR